MLVETHQCGLRMYFCQFIDLDHSGVSQYLVSNFASIASVHRCVPKRVCVFVHLPCALAPSCWSDCSWRPPPPFYMPPTANMPSSLSPNFYVCREACWISPFLFAARGIVPRQSPSFLCSSTAVFDCGVCSHLRCRVQFYVSKTIPACPAPLRLNLPCTCTLQRPHPPSGLNTAQIQMHSS